MIDEERNAARGLIRPLCRRYALVRFDTVAVRLRDAQGVAGPHAWCAHWAFGWLDDEECEFLGAWMGLPQGLPRMLADLRHRGITRIRAVAAAEHAQAGVGAVLSDTAVYPFVDELIAPARVAPPAERVAERIRGSLVRAIARHGSFESATAVLDFMAGALQRAERRLDRERSIAKARPRQDAGVRMVPPGL